MREWILGLQKGAVRAGPGATEEQLVAAEGAWGGPMPPELREVYANLDGADLPGEVTLFSIETSEGQPGVLDASRTPLPGVADAALWRFGSRGGSDDLFAARRRDLSALGEAPAWLDGVGDDEWIFGLREEGTGEIWLFRTLERLLWKTVPPAETEDFGENTFASALRAVKGALVEAATRAVTATPIEAVGPRSVAKLRSAVKRAVKKALPKKAAKASAKRAPQAKRSATKKQTAASKKRKGATKKPARRTPAKRSPSKPRRR